MIVYRYGLRSRPPGLGAVPKGFVPNPLLYVSAPVYANRYRWGYIDYPEKLSDDDARSYEITFIGERESNTAEINPEPN